MIRQPANRARFGDYSRGDRTSPAHQAEDSLVGSLGWPMADVQLGKQIPDADVRAIAAFLETLTGEVPAQFRVAGSEAPGSK